MGRNDEDAWMKGMGIGMKKEIWKEGRDGKERLRKGTNGETKRE